jgi:hypothetical protein
MQVGIIFLALAGLEAAVPYALSVVTAEGRARFGKSAVIAAVTAISVIMIADVGARFVAHAVPSAGEVAISVPGEVATLLPALTEGGVALMAAIVLSGIVALYAVTLRRWAAAITIVAVFFATLDPLVTMQQAPLMIVRGLVVALIVWVLAKYVLDANPLAWPLFVFFGTTLQTAASLAHNSRPDLLANALVLVLFAAGAAVWAWRSNDRIVRVASAPVEVQPLPGVSGERSSGNVHSG